MGGGRGFRDIISADSVVNLVDSVVNSVDSIVNSVDSVKSTTGGQLVPYIL